MVVLCKSSLTQDVIDFSIIPDFTVNVERALHTKKEGGLSTIAPRILSALLARLSLLARLRLLVRLTRTVSADGMNRAVEIKEN